MAQQQSSQEVAVPRAPWPPPAAGSSAAAAVGGLRARLRLLVPVLTVAPESAQAGLMLDMAVIEAESLASALAAAAPGALPALRTARFRHAAGEQDAAVSELAAAHGALARAASLG